MRKTAFILMANGFEEIEFMAPVDILRRGGVLTKTISIHESTSVLSARGIQITADYLLEEVEDERCDLVFLPGGGEGTDNLMNHPKVIPFLQKLQKQGVVMTAICAAPKVLSKAGILNGKEATAYPSSQSELLSGGAKVIEDQNVVELGDVVTSQGPGTAAEMGFALLEKLMGAKVAKIVRKGMLF